MVDARVAGDRRSEVLGLRWEGVNIKGHVLRVERTMIYLKVQGHVWSEPKTSTQSNLILS